MTKGDKIFFSVSYAVMSVVGFALSARITPENFIGNAALAQTVLIIIGGVSLLRSISFLFELRRR